MYTAKLKQLLKHLILLESTRFKRETGENLPRWQEKLIRYEKAGGFYVHFSDVPRLGLFTRNKYKTPIGFYSYPLDREKISDFAIERPYALILKPKPEARLLDLGSYSQGDLSEDVQKLTEAGYSIQAIDRASRGAAEKTAGGVVWNITRVLSGADKTEKFLQSVGKEKETRLPKKAGGPTGTWTMLLRKLGYDGVVDEGKGIIHRSEPYQAVFFDTTKVELVEVIDKKGGEGGVESLFSVSLEGRDLRGKDFSGKDLSESNLRNAVLLGVSLVGANLQDATMNQANLISADMSEANLARALLRGCSVKNTKFQRADLRSAGFWDAIGDGADFTDAKAENAVFHGAFLRKAVFANCGLQEAKFAAGIFVGASFREANLTWAECNNADFTAADFQGAKLQGTDFTGSTLVEADFRNTDLSRVGWLGAKFQDALYNSATKFPEGFEQEKSRMKLS